MKFARLFAVLALPLLLSSCFLVPGAFTSSLDIRRDGSFTFAYKGEMIYQTPDDMTGKGQSAKIWSEAKARCYTDKEREPYYDEYGSEDDTKTTAAQSAADAISTADEAAAVYRRACTKAEIAKLKTTWDEEQAAALAKKKKDSAEMAAVFGYAPGDDEANRKLAATMMKYDGWKTVTYRGKGVFDVDYSLSSKMGHDFLFPVIPQSGDMIIPFAAIKRRENGAVMVNAPALVGGGIRALAARGKALGLGGSKDMPDPSQITKGSFTITTDAEILTNNTDDGPAKDGRGRKLAWDIGPGTEKIPEALIQLK